MDTHLDESVHDALLFEDGKLFKKEKEVTC
jgi:hypothetical protein